MSNVIYLGPEIRGVVKRNQVFSYDAADVKAKAAQVSELTQYLFVAMDDVAAAKKELKTQGSLMEIAFKKVYQILQEVK